MNRHKYKNLDGEHIIGGPFTGWQLSDAVIHATCPKCSCDAGYHCERPNGRKAWPPHVERLIELNKTGYSANVHGGL